MKRANNATFRAAHPWIAYLLSKLGEKIANSTEPICESWLFIVLGLILAALLNYGVSIGVI